ncbi:MAG: glycosyltransferase family 25 protein [Devosia sp.]
MQVYYINLASRIDRRAFMETQLSAIGLTFTRIEAVTPNDLSAADIKRYCNSWRHHWLTPPELACWSSHLRAMSALLASDAPYALILEDDSILSERVPAFLFAFEVAAPPYDICRLEVIDGIIRYRRGLDPDIADVAMLRPYGRADGCGAYILSRRAASAILDAPRLRAIAADIILFDPYGPLRHLSMRHTDPALSVQNVVLKSPIEHSFSSDIEAARAVRYRNVWHSPWRLPYRILDALHKHVVVAVQRAWHRYIGGARRQRIRFAPR